MVRPAERVRSATLALVFAGAGLVACRPTTERPAPVEAGTALFEVASAATAPRATDPSGSCAADADCHAGLVCFFVNPGCEPSSRVGECREPSWGHECAVNHPMCSCDGRTLWGKPCLGIIRERWSRAERCSCRGDSDCKGGQQCVFTSAGCDKAGQCDDPAFVKCAAATATFCTCKGTTAARTCAQTMREPWAKASACGR